MILSPMNSLIIIFGIACATMLTRALPFILFPEGSKTPEYIIYLGKVLPYAIIGMLVVYCLKGVQPVSFPYALPELFAVAVVIVLHLWKRNTLLSIGGGTLVYMLLIRFVFVHFSVH